MKLIALVLAPTGALAADALPPPFYVSTVIAGHQFGGETPSGGQQLSFTYAQAGISATGVALSSPELNFSAGGGNARLDPLVFPTTYAIAAGGTYMEIFFSVASTTDTTARLDLMSFFYWTAASSVSAAVSIVINPADTDDLAGEGRLASIAGPGCIGPVCSGGTRQDSATGLVVNTNERYGLIYAVYSEVDVASGQGSAASFVSAALALTPGQADAGHQFALDFSPGFSNTLNTDPSSAALVPEPGTAALMALGLAGLLAGHRRRPG